MSWRSFLYRRLSRWITCEPQLASGAWLPLRTKYDVASFSDVFCHPFYWQIFSLLDSPPHEVVDCGACCGHFSILAEQCLRARFGTHTTQFVLIEANPLVLPLLKHNLSAAGIYSRATIIHGVLGTAPDADNVLWVSRSNYLNASVTPFRGGKAFRVPSCTLSQVISGENRNGLLKIDIEGAEYECVQRDPAILSRFQLIMMELHGEESLRQQLITRIRQQLGPTGAPIVHAGQTLVAFKR